MLRRALLPASVAVSAAACLVLAPAALAAPARVQAQTSGRQARAADVHAHARADSPRTIPAPPGGAPRAPAAAPLTPGGQPPVADEEGIGSAQEGESDPLVGNGFSSPTCAPSDIGDLALSAKRHCATSGFVAAAAPTGDYGVDVHIDTGFLGLSDGGLLSAVQDLFVTPVWMAAVWVVHALVVMLEWCFSLDLLSSSAVSGLAPALRRMEAAFTAPWLPLALALASLLTLYHGIVRRRVAETLGEVALTVGMMAAGLWVIVDPLGTVGALSRWSEQAATGALATAAQGSPAHSTRALGDGLATVFSVAVEGPWCYLEFGDVEWCRQPSRLDPRLRSAGLEIAAEEQMLAGCHGGTSALEPCAAEGSEAARTLRRSAQLLREAQSNGAIFLALPANGPARNSINDERSLLRTICRSAQATSCHGPSAAQAEFRTNGGTWSRVGGLILIVAGLLGMLLLLGYLALRLLSAAIFSLLYLLLAPAMVLAPAFGDGGRAVFRRWSTHLLGNVVAKLIYSFLLGVVLALLGLLAGLGKVGWWTQWLLSATLWWGAFLRRHQALGVAAGAGGQARARAGPTSTPSRVLNARNLGAARWARSKLAGERDGVREPAEAPSSRGERPVQRALEQLGARRRDRVRATLGRGGGDARAGAAERVGSESEEQGARAQLRRIEAALLQARGARDVKRGARLAHRAERVRADLAGARTAGEKATSRGEARATAERSGGAGAAESQVPARHAALPTGTDAREAREALVEELALPGRRPAGERPAPVTRPDRDEHRPSAPEATPSPAVPRRLEPESQLMRDAREVAAGRKRQLGRDRP